MYFNAWAIDQNSELESKKDALEVQRIAEQKQLDSLLDADLSNSSVMRKVSQLDSNVASLAEEIEKIEQQIAKARLSGSKAHSTQTMLQLIDIADESDSTDSRFQRVLN